MGLRLEVGCLSINNDTVPLKGHTVRPPTARADRGVRTADCGRRSANGFFYVDVRFNCTTIFDMVCIMAIMQTIIHNNYS